MECGEKSSSSPNSPDQSSPDEIDDDKDLKLEESSDDSDYEMEVLDSLNESSDEEEEDELSILRIGSRNSTLALIQSKFVADAVTDLFPIKCQIDGMSTIGDKNVKDPLKSFGQTGIFTKELEERLIDGRHDVVVHSLKDLPSCYMNEQLVICSVSERETVHDVLLFAPKVHVHNLDKLPDNLTLGTSSPRRIAQINYAFGKGKFNFKDIRGNIQTRLFKLRNKDKYHYSATLMAGAALDRLEIDYDNFMVRFGEYNPAIFDGRLKVLLEYAAGQGSLAIQCSRGNVTNEEIGNLIKSMSDAPSLLRCICERAILKELNAGCSTPISMSTSIVPMKKQLAVYDSFEGISHMIATIDLKMKLCVTYYLDDGERMIHLEQTRILRSNENEIYSMSTEEKNGMIEYNNILIPSSSFYTSDTIMMVKKRKKTTSPVRSGTSSDHSSPSYGNEYLTEIFNSDGVGELPNESIVSESDGENDDVMNESYADLFEDDDIDEETVQSMNRDRSQIESSSGSNEKCLIRTRRRNISSDDGNYHNGRVTLDETNVKSKEHAEAIQEFNRTISKIWNRNVNESDFDINSESNSEETTSEKDEKRKTFKFYSLEDILNDDERIAYTSHYKWTKGLFDDANDLGKSIAIEIKRKLKN
ncbi:hypothetical protein SNEBB_001872 [Seison nebaliae]|nr:hypothetical protein SNEBB_001872 [Seison nebaliae]